MKKVILIGLGGFLGAILRFYIKNIHIYHYKEAVPLNTLIINISGSLILALLLTIAYEIWEMDEAVRLGIATGFLGAFTTFSSMCKETVALFEKGYYYSAVSYAGMSSVFGLCAAYFGVVIAREFVAKTIENK